MDQHLALPLSLVPHQQPTKPLTERTSSTTTTLRLTSPLPPLPSTTTTPAPTSTTKPRPQPRLSISTHIPYRDDPSPSAASTAEAEVVDDEDTAGENINLATLQVRLREHAPPLLSPPGYEPMYDYLRAHRLRMSAGGNGTMPPVYSDSGDLTSTSDSAGPTNPNTNTIPNLPRYRDEPTQSSYEAETPFIITIPSTHPFPTTYSDNPSSPNTREGEETEQAPPSYLSLYHAHQAELARLNQQFDNQNNGLGVLGVTAEGSTPAEQAEELIKWVVAMMMVCLTIAGVGTAFNWGR